MVNSGQKTKRKLPMMLFLVKMKEDRSTVYDYKLNSKKSTNNVFTTKQTTKKVGLKLFRGFQVTKNLRLLF